MTLWGPPSLLVPLAALAIVAGCGGEKPLTDLFRMKTPSLVGPIKKVKLGGDVAAARESHKTLMQKGGFRDDTWGGNGGIKFEGFADPTNRLLQTVKMSFAPEHKDLEKTLLKIWGDPVKAQLWAGRTQDAKGKTQKLEASFWFDSANGLRAAYYLDPTRGNKRTIEYTHYMPLAAMWGSKPGRPAWMVKPLLGSTMEELQAAYPGLVKENDKRAKIHLPATEWAPFHTVVIVSFDPEDKKCSVWEIRHDFQPKPDAEAALVKTLSAIYGKGKPPTKIERDKKPWEAKSDHWAFQKEPDPLTVTLVDYGTLSSLTVRKTPPPPPLEPCPEDVKCPPPCEKTDKKECPEAPPCCSYVPPKEGEGAKDAKPGDKGAKDAKPGDKGAKPDAKGAKPAGDAAAPAAAPAGDAKPAKPPSEGATKP